MPLRNPTDFSGAWNVAIMTNGWINYGSPFANLSYRRDAENVVWLRGAIVSLGITTLITTLPIGYRPAYSKVFYCPSGDGGATVIVGQVIISSDGAVTYQSGAGAIFILDAIAFLVNS